MRILSSTPPPPPAAPHAVIHALLLRVREIFLFVSLLHLWTPTRSNPAFSFTKLVISLIFQAGFQTKMTGCESEVNDSDFCLYILVFFDTY